MRAGKTGPESNEKGRSRSNPRQDGSEGGRKEDCSKNKAHGNQACERRSAGTGNGEPYLKEAAQPTGRKRRPDGHQAQLHIERRQGERTIARALCEDAAPAKNGG